MTLQKTITSQETDTSVEEIAEDLFRISTPIPPAGPSAGAPPFHRVLSRRSGRVRLFERLAASGTELRAAM